MQCLFTKQQRPFCCLDKFPCDFRIYHLVAFGLKKEGLNPRCPSRTDRYSVLFDFFGNTLKLSPYQRQIKHEVLISYVLQSEPEPCSLSQSRAGAFLCMCYLCDRFAHPSHQESFFQRVAHLSARFDRRQPNSFQHFTCVNRLSRAKECERLRSIAGLLPHFTHCRLQRCLPSLELPFRQCPISVTASVDQSDLHRSFRSGPPQQATSSFDHALNNTTSLSASAY